MTTMEEVRCQLAQLRDLKLEISQKEDELKQLRGDAYAMEHSSLVDTFNELGITTLSIDADGNLPAVTAKLKPYFKANIEAAWDADRRKAAFDYLHGIGAGDLIKTIFTVALPRNSAAATKKVRAALDKLGIDYGEEQNVPWNTLTAWLKESYEQGDEPELDVIGGTAGQIVTLKENNER
jgi:hypothetical protein